MKDAKPGTPSTAMPASTKSQLSFGIRGARPPIASTSRVWARSAMVAVAPTIRAAASPPAISWKVAPRSAMEVIPETPRANTPPGTRAA